MGKKSKYIDANALKNQRPENLNNRCKNYDKAVYASGWNDCNECWCDLIDEMPAADVEPVRKWISVNERLPEGENVLLCTRSKNGSRNIDKGYYLEGSWVHRSYAEVTHWMSLPELPKMDGGSE